MLKLASDEPGDEIAHVLCIGAHCDDIEIGCAGTLLSLQERRRNLRIHWAVLSGIPEARRLETQRSMERLVAPAQRGTLRFGDFADGRFPASYGSIKEFFEALKDLPRPELVLCHERGDLHQDHRIVNEMVWNTFRNHLVLEYEVPKWDGGLGQPNVFLPITELQAQIKVDTLLEVYGTQHSRDWFTADTFMALMRLRGVECRSDSGLAEAFHGRKIVI